MCVCVCYVHYIHTIPFTAQFFHSNLESTTEEVTLTNSGHKVCAVYSKIFTGQKSLRINIMLILAKVINTKSNLDTAGP